MRRDFPAKVKAAAALRAGGHCEACTRKLMTGDYHYDHDTPDAMGGEPTLENCKVLCRSCHSVKTLRQDVPRIAKAKRRERNRLGIKKPRTITRWRRFNGDAVYAERNR
ncbi:MAG TPA: HNH endonuclease signature motif containing protein [Pseudolabrys sp.]|nr:HNH endonuclease signature motif containing protein [Pseudolabrys sp.]